MTRRGFRLLLFLVSALAMLAWTAPARAEDAPAPPAAAGAADKPAIDEKARTVSVPAVAAKQGTYEVLKGAIEYVLVSKGGKEYESLFVTPCPAQDLHDALVKLGLAPGAPATDDAPPKGRPVRILVELRRDGKTVRRPIEDFLAYIKEAKPVEPQLWIFTGSTRLTDPDTGKASLQASATQNLIGLHYQDPSPLIANPRPECRTSNIYRASPKELPAAGTPVRIIFERPAAKVPEGTRRVHVFVSGRVQGVGYRAFTEGQARRLKLAGWVRNLSDGRVESVIEGPARSVQELLDQMKRGPLAAKVEKLQADDEPPQGDFESFEVTVEGATP